MVFSGPPSSPITPQQAFESFLGEVANYRKLFPGNVRFYVEMEGQKVVAFDKASGTVYTRRDAIDVRTAQFEVELAQSTGGQVDDTVRFKMKVLQAISSKLPFEVPLDKFNYETYTASDIAEDFMPTVDMALEKLLDKVRK
jgi:hypothetical protein